MGSVKASRPGASREQMVCQPIAKEEEGDGRGRVHLIETPPKEVGGEDDQRMKMWLAVARLVAHQRIW